MNTYDITFSGEYPHELNKSAPIVRATSTVQQDEVVTLVLVATAYVPGIR
jgi:hypothetical protein